MGKKGKLQLVMRILFDHIAGLCQFNHDGAGIGVAVKPKHGGKLAAIHNHIFGWQVGQSEGLYVGHAAAAPADLEHVHIAVHIFGDQDLHHIDDLGTLKSQRTRTFLPATSISSTVFLFR